ncbi:MAG TPA: NAD(P)-dependent oxidoreductase [Baekduia sp.]
MTEPLHVVVATALVRARDADALADRLGPGTTVTHLPVPWVDGDDPPATISADWLATMRAADVLVAFAQQVPDLLARPVALALVQHAGAGVDAVDVDAFRRAGVGLVTAAGVGARSVGDFAVAAVLALALRHPERAEAQREHRWERFATAELTDRRALVVGAGPVGGRVCAVLAALGLDVTAARRRPELGPPPGATRVIGLDAVADAVAAADVLVLAIALGPETEGLIGAAELERLPKRAVVVNVGRGPLVDELAVAAALRTGHLAGAWLDVFAREPLPADSPLWDVPNLRISAHDATATIGYSRRLADRAADTVLAWRAGTAVPHAVVAPVRSAA